MIITLCIALFWVPIAIVCIRLDPFGGFGVNGVEWPLIEKDSLGQSDATNGTFLPKKLDAWLRIPYMIRIPKFRVLH